MSHKKLKKAREKKDKTEKELKKTEKELADAEKRLAKATAHRSKVEQSLKKKTAQTQSCVELYETAKADYEAIKTARKGKAGQETVPA